MIQTKQNHNQSLISNLFTLYWSFNKDVASNIVNLCEELPTKEFIQFISMRGMRSRGIDIENRLAIKNKWSKTKRSDEAGDLIDSNKKRVEVKSSLVSPLKRKITLRGFRPWEDKIHYYLIVVSDISDYQNKILSYFFEIPPDFINSKNGFSPFSQSKKARIGSKNIPLGINIDLDSQRFDFWKKNFLRLDIKF